MFKDKNRNQGVILWKKGVGGGEEEGLALCHIITNIEQLKVA